LELTLGELAGIAGASLRGDAQLVINRVATLQDAGPGAIAFLANPRYRAYLADTRASAVILGEEDAEACPTACLISANPYLAHARVSRVLHPEPVAAPGVDSTAVVDATATLASDVRIGANSYVGPGVVLEQGVDIGPNCVLLEAVHVGRDSRLVASVTLCAGTRLGQRCLVHPGAVIGGDGFGLANDGGAWVKVPQVGRACLGDDVEVGSCSSIDRGAIGDTVIADGVKIDSQVHIAHNVQVGRHSAIAGCAAIAGSSRVGEHCTIAGGAGITGHVVLTDHVHVSGVTAVTRSIKQPGVYTGTVPAMEHAVWQKNFARLRHLEQMQRRLRLLEQELAALRGVVEAATPDGASTTQSK
jgi:UDP-3-O-[3-hydroxymyristoyl] glucosamine N-acyltransferase